MQRILIVIGVILLAIGGAIPPQSEPVAHAEEAQTVQASVPETTQEAPQETPAPETQPVAETPVATAPKPQTASYQVPDQPAEGYARDSKEYWMLSAGIPPEDWQFVDALVSKESSWNPNAVNPSSGACGLAQALPCEKVGANWNNPVTSLKWQYGYVLSRYGGYAQAWNFWLANHWY